MSRRTQLQAAQDDGLAERIAKWLLKYAIEGALVLLVAAGAGLGVNWLFEPVTYLGFRLDGRAAALATLAWYGHSEACFLTDDEPF